MTFRILLLLILTSPNLFGQVKPSGSRYLTRSYDYQETGANLANWQIMESQNGLIYAGNTDGLLIFDGTKWKRYFDIGILSIYESKSGQIYIGALGDFGYLSSSDHGDLQYNTLSNKLPKDFELNSAVWSIAENSSGIYFYSKEGVIRWNGEKMKAWASNSFKNKVVTNEKNAYVIDEKYGIIELSENGSEKVKGTQILRDDFLNFFYPITKDSVIIGTRYGGVFTLEKDSLLVPIDGEISEFIKRNQLFSHRFKGKRRVIGSITGGLQIYNDSLILSNSLNTDNGLANNFVKGIEIDKHQNLWCSLPDNISMFEISSPVQLWDSNSGLEGSPWKAGAAFNKDFIGTTKGLFLHNGTSFKKIKGINSKIWAISKIRIDDKTEALIVSSEQGLLTVYQDLSYQSIDGKGDTHVYNLRISPNKIIVSKTTGISILTFKNSKFEKKEIISFSNKDQVVHDVCEDNNGEIWIGAVNQGVYRVKNINSDSPDIQLYNESKGFPNIGEPSIAFTKLGMLVGNSNGLYVLDRTTDSFIKSNLILGNIKQMSTRGDSILYVAIGNNEGLIDIQKLSIKSETDIERTVIPFKRIHTSSVIDIYPSNKDQLWITTPEGAYQFDETIEKDYTIPYHTLIRKVVNQDSILFNGTYSEPIPGKLAPKIVVNQPSSYIPNLAFERNSIRFEYASTFYELPERTEYSYFLEGNDKQWSSWSTEHVKEYNNLSAGEYTFKVKAKNIYDFEGEITSYQFTILAPWYQTSWALVLFTFSGGVLLWFIVLAYSYRVRQHRKKLKLIVADRTFEVISQKKEIEKQNDLLKEQNEQISSQRDAINVKNVELELSQEEILKINKKLQELNGLLEKKVEQRTSKIKQTLQQLQQTNAELDTFIYRASHDLKGPISRIHGLTSLAKLESTSPNDLKYYDLIELVAKDMNKLLAKLTQVHEVIHATVDKELIDLPVLISEVRNNINFLDQSADTKYSFDLKSTLQVKSDPFLLTIILTNLMENAVIFKRNSVSEHQIIIKADEDSENYYIEVIDNGLGIAADHLNKVFNMFFRGSDQSKGSGLGLYLVKVAIEKLHGDISVTSTMNDNTTFWVKIPK